MLSGGIGISSPGQFAPGKIGLPSASVILITAAPDRTFLVPQNGLVWQGFKTPETVLNFSFDWSDEIGADQIVKSVWELESADLAQGISNIDAAGLITTVLLSNGVSANVYNVTNLITTESGLQLDATFRLFVNQYNGGCC